MPRYFFSYSAFTTLGLKDEWCSGKTVDFTPPLGYDVNVTEVLLKQSSIVACCRE